MKSKEKLSIVIPARNEEKRIVNTLRVYGDYFRKKGVNFEILVVLNNCTDNTLGVVKEAQKEFKEIRYLDLEPGGKGFALIEGFKDALKRDNELIGFVDADMSSPPGAFYDLVKNIGDADGAIADRWAKGSKMEYSAFKKVRSLVYNYYVRGLFWFPYRDTQCGAKLFKRKILEENIHKIVSSNFNIDVALLFCFRKESNARIKSVPTFWIDREGTTVNLMVSPAKMFLAAMRLRLIHSPFKFVVRFYRDVWPKFLKM